MSADEAQSGNFWGRVLLAGIGGFAGLVWWFAENSLAGMVPSPRAYLFASVLLQAFFINLLLLAGTVGLIRAFPASLAIALPPALLLSWASTRHATLDGFFDRLDPIVAGVVIAFLPLPFVIAQLSSPKGWRDYARLFDESWAIVVRIAAVALFELVFWLALLLSNEVLQLAGVSVISDLLSLTWFPPLLSGLVAGLALAFVAELDDPLSYSLILRLLRLMIAPALLVIGAFAIALPSQGYDVLLGVLSPAGTLVGIAVVLVVLVNAGIGASDDRSAQTLFLRLCTRGLALLVPVMSGLAVVALWLRISDHGLSPGRMALGAAALVLSAYGVIYAASVLFGARWMRIIRRGNILMAGVVFILAVLWLTPVLNPERLSANHVLARFESGETPADDVDLWALRNEWGAPGNDALQQITAMGDATIERRLSLLEVAPDRASFERPSTAPAGGNSRAALQEILPVMPPEAREEFDRFVLPWYAGSVTGFLDGCNDRTETGNPGCVLIVADLLPENPGNEGILFYKSFGLLRGEVIVPEPIFRRADASDVFSVPPPDFAETDVILDELQAGNFDAGPARINAITIGRRQFTVPF